MNDEILVINGGSSSVKFAVFSNDRSLERRVSGRMERIGLPAAFFSAREDQTGRNHHHRKRNVDPLGAVAAILDFLRETNHLSTLRAIGHRVVHGGRAYTRPVVVDARVLNDIERLGPFVPDHLPAEVRIMRELKRRFPRLPQIACFDTAFHRAMPFLSKILPIPRKYFRRGVERYGFHGLSYSYLLGELNRLEKKKQHRRRVVIAHLGNGASLAAVKNRRAVDTTMAFTPAAGIPMSTRSGDLDPGLVSYLARTEKMSLREFHKMVNTRSGLLGISETSSDVRDLLGRARRDPRAREAIDVFCRQTAKAIAALAVSLGGLDTLIFSGGIGENSAVIRTRISAWLSFMGLRLDESRNKKGAALISSTASAIQVRVIRTDEEGQIAKSVRTILRQSKKFRRFGV